MALHLCEPSHEPSDFVVVNYLMFLQSTWMNKFLVTKLTRIWLFTCVNCPMSLQSIWFDCVNFLSQNLHEYGFLLVWILSWCFKLCAYLVTTVAWICLFTSVNYLMLLQSTWMCKFLVLHEYGFLPVWILSWIFKTFLVIYFLSQNLHKYCFLPVWILSWSFKALNSLNFLSQNLHEYGLSSVWIMSWSFKALKLCKFLVIKLT